MAIQLHLVAESCIICSSRSSRPVRKLLDTPSYMELPGAFQTYTQVNEKLPGGGGSGMQPRACMLKAYGPPAQLHINETEITVSSSWRYYLKARKMSAASCIRSECFTSAGKQRKRHNREPHG